MTTNRPRTLEGEDRLRSHVDLWKKLKAETEEARGYFELAREENDEETLKEVGARVAQVRRTSRPRNSNACWGERTTGTTPSSPSTPGPGNRGPGLGQHTPAHVPAMAERKGFRTEMIDTLDGEEAGIKSATLRSPENLPTATSRPRWGIHRLVRISPFDAGKRRHTSFASVFVYPEIDEDIVIEIKDEDLRVDTFRSSGPEGST